MFLGHLAFILGPPVALTLILTSDWKGTLRLRWPKIRDVADRRLAWPWPSTRPSASLAVAVEKLFPTSEAMRSLLGEMAKQVPSVWAALLVFALMPAITEEVAFRGFILSGLRRTYSARTAVILSALLFGFLHVLLSLFQQLFGATVLGLVLGFLALRTGSLWPGVVFHFVTNALGVLTLEGANHRSLAPISGILFRDRAEGLYRLGFVLPTAILSVFLLYAIWRGGPIRKPAPEVFEG